MRVPGTICSAQMLAVSSLLRGHQSNRHTHVAIHTNHACVPHLSFCTSPLSTAFAVCVFLLSIVQRRRVGFVTRCSHSHSGSGDWSRMDRPKWSHSMQFPVSVCATLMIASDCHHSILRRVVADCLSKVDGDRRCWRSIGCGCFDPYLRILAVSFIPSRYSSARCGRTFALRLVSAICCCLIDVLC